MLKPIVKDIFFLRRKAEEATREDIQIGIDLQRTHFGRTRKRVWEWLRI